MSIAPVHGQNRLMTINDVDSAVVYHNLQLRTSRLEIDAAEGQLKQAKLYENPEVEVQHNVQNPENKVWLDTGYWGQTDVQISQPIAIGGQHRSRVRQQREALHAVRAGYESELLDVRSDARNVFIDLYYTQQKLRIYDKEIASVEKIQQAFDEQTAKGNVSRMENFRIGAMLSQLRSEQAALLMSEADQQKELSLLLNTGDQTPIEAVVDEDGMTQDVVATLAQLMPVVTQQDAASLTAYLQQHPAMTEKAHQEASSRYAVKAEKADALPHIALNGEWDKNGNIGHNYFGIGATISIPLWNRNQGNIRTAKAQHAQAVIDRQAKEQELRESMLMLYRTTTSTLQLVEQQRKHLSADLDQLLTAAEEQYMKRNLSTLEFVDLYGSYREAHMQLADAKAQLLKNHEELKKYIIR